MPLDQLRAYRPEVRRPADLDAFWADTIAAARTAGAGTAPALDVQDLTFPGFGGDPVRAWVSRPAGTADQDLPVVVEFLGYGGGRGLPGERVSWALAGFVHVVMDTRGQGSGWGSGGDTPDPHGSVPHVGGWMASGVDAPANHYYRRVFTDAVRLVEAVRTLPGVDVDRIALTGGSQGGGIKDVAFLCDWEHGTAVAVGGPYLELATHLSVHRDDVDRVWDTVAYFDGVHFAERISAPALFSVALMDDVVPPRTTFAAYNALGSADHEIAVYPYNGHEGGGFRHWERQVAFLRERL
ncbi:acetylxylan esterase [Curtobacterium sp. Csp1]|uniref:acetylxylan esterase n=1 Tax=Curtobacterium sp. Csp1 TaxID=2495429 RepID=UPI001598EE2F|nr:acetylxylan esterase [Curtobacterium sp. Csp1]QKS22097.1 acetylxylan esterase [Curtobacterium sp. Csp1]